MRSSAMRRLLRLAFLCLLLGAAMAAAQELPPMAVQPSVLAASGGKHKVFVTLGNRTALGMDTVKLTVVSNSGESKFGELPELNPYQWLTVSGTAPDDDSQVLVVEYVLNDKPQKVSMMLSESAAAPASPLSAPARNLPSALWLGGAALLGAMVTLAGAAVGRRSGSR
jgi:hypothetical protein